MLYVFFLCTLFSLENGSWEFPYFVLGKARFMHGLGLEFICKKLLFMNAINLIFIFYSTGTISAVYGCESEDLNQGILIKRSSYIAENLDGLESTRQADLSLIHKEPQWRSFCTIITDDTKARYDKSKCTGVFKDHFGVCFPVFIIVILGCRRWDQYYFECDPVI